MLIVYRGIHAGDTQCRPYISTLFRISHEFLDVASVPLWKNPFEIFVMKQISAPLCLCGKFPK